MDTEPTLTLELPRKMNRFEGGAVDQVVLHEPQLRHLLISEKETEKLVTAHTIRARDIKLLSVVSKLTEDEIKTLPVSMLNRATQFLRGFTEGEADDKWNDGERPESLTIALDPPLRAPDGEEFEAFTVSEPNTGTTLAAEKILNNGLNLFSLRQYQHTLLTRASDLPKGAASFLPISKVDEACRYLQSFIDPGPATPKI